MLTVYKTPNHSTRGQFVHIFVIDNKITQAFLSTFHLTLYIASKSLAYGSTF